MTVYFERYAGLLYTWLLRSSTLEWAQKRYLNILLLFPSSTISKRGFFFQYTPAVDMWSIGVILYILLSVWYPFTFEIWFISKVSGLISTQGNSPFDNEDEHVRIIFRTFQDLWLFFSERITDSYWFFPSGFLMQVLFQKIRSGEYSLDGMIWDHVSSDAKDCVQQLLTVSWRLGHARMHLCIFIIRLVQVDTGKRMTVSDALRHPWVLVCNFLLFFIVNALIIELFCRGWTAQTTELSPLRCARRSTQGSWYGFRLSKPKEKYSKCSLFRSQRTLESFHLMQKEQLLEWQQAQGMMDQSPQP